MKHISFGLISLFIIGCQSPGLIKENEIKQKNMVSAAKTNLQLGMEYLRRNDVDRAKQKFILAVSEAPLLPEVWYSMAYFQETTGNNTLADKYYQKAIKLAPLKGESHNNYGTFLCRKGRYQSSISEFMRAVQDENYLSPASAYENAGLCAMKIPNTELAKENFRKSLSEDPRRHVSEMELRRLENKNLT